MAFTPEQRARLKARTQELVVAGMEKGPAAQQAYRDLLASNPEVALQFQSDGPVRTEVREQEREKNLRETAQMQEAPRGSVEAETERYRKTRAAELLIDDPNLSNAAAGAIAQKEVQEQFLQPAPYGYGAPFETAEETFIVPTLDALASLGGLGRQVEEVIPPPRPKEEEALYIPGVTVNWDELQKQFVDELGIPENEVAADVDSFKQNFYRPALDAAREEGLSGEEAAEAALTSSFAQFSNMGERLADKESYITDNIEQEGPNDPWYRTFTRQLTPGEGIPDLTDNQRAYLNEREERAIQAETDRVLATNPTRLEDGDFFSLTRDEVEEQVREDMQTWWLQEGFQERINRPDLSTEYGYFEDVSPLGTRQETVSGWLLRSAIAPFNIIPGLISEAIAPGEESQEYDFTDRVLTNVAENRGFMGEGQVMMTEAGITPEENPYAYRAGTALGFALDILDPSLDIVKAAGAGTRSAARYGSTVNRLYGSPELLESVGVGTKFALKSFLDDYIVTSLIGKTYDPGTVRNIAANRLRRDIDGAVVAEQALRSDADALVDDALITQVRNTGSASYANYLTTKKGDRLKDAVDEGRNLIRTSDNVLEQAGRVAEDLEAMAAGGQPRNLKNAQVARVVRSLALDSDALKAAFKSGGIKKVLADADLRSQVRTALSADIALDAVAKSTKNLPAAIDDVVAVTENTFAGRKAAKEILKRTKESEIGKLISNLNSKNIKLVTSNSRISSVNPVIPAYRLDNNYIKAVNSAINELRDLGILETRRANAMAVSVKRNKALAVDDARLLLDKTADAYASARALKDTKNASSVLRPSEISQLAPKRQMELLEPFERRTFATRKLGDLYTFLRGDKPIEILAGPAQRNMIKRASAEGKNIVKRLGSLMSSLTKDLNTQKAYGIIDNAADTVADITPDVAMSYAILGPKFRETQDGLNINKNILISALQSTFKTDRTLENLFDNLTGTSVRNNTSPFSDSFFKIIDGEIAASAGRLLDNRGNFFEELNKLIGNVEYLKNSMPDIFRVPVEDIKPFRTSDNKIPVELQIIAYIKAEASRITDKVLEDFVIKATSDLLGADFINQLTKAGAVAIDIDPVGNVTRTRVIMDATVDAVKYKMQGRDILEEFIAGGRTNIPPGYRDADAVELAYKYGNDLADVIMQANRIAPGDLDVRQVESLVNSVLGSPQGKESIRALYGEEIADQLITQFNDGFKGARDQLLEELRVNYKGRGIDKAGRILKLFISAFQNARYFVMLNLRPRFHAVNILTGAEIFYQNLGRLPELRDITRAIRIQGDPRGPTNAVALTTPSGKNYTETEMLRILQDQTGQSVYKPDLYADISDIRKIKRLAKGKEDGLARRAFEGFQELPQSSDLVFRYAALAKGLREGRSESEAIEMARKAMFDRADISNLERKTIGQAALFYSFARSALATSLRNLTSAKGIKRIKNVARSKDFAQDMLIPEGTSDREIADFAPNYAAARMAYRVTPTDAKEGKYEIMMTPSVPTLQSFETFAEILKGNISGVVSGFIAPEYKYLLNVQDPFSRDYNEVPAEHLAILEAVTSGNEDSIGNVINLIMYVFGGKPRNIIPTPQKAPNLSPEPGESDFLTSVSYKFVTPSQKRAYKYFMMLVGVLGLTAVASDIGRAIPTEQPVRGAGPDAEQDLLGFTPMSAGTPERQAYYDRLTRMRRIKDVANNLKRTENERIESVIELTEEERENQEYIEEMGEERDEMERTLDPETKALIRLRELRSQIRSAPSEARREELIEEYYALEDSISN